MHETYVSIMKKLIFTNIFLLIAIKTVFASEIIGKVICKDLPVSFANIQILGQKKGTQADENGKFELRNLPKGKLTLIITSIGYKSKKQTFSIAENKPTHIVIELEEEASQLKEVVVSGTLKEISINDSPAPIQILNPTFFKKNPTPNLFESLSMVNGVRPQLNCNVCNTGDIHINGMEGPYTMILIDGIPIVSSLSTVYGLMGIPNSIVERIEIMKGPSSTLYGSEAVGGLINVITKNPQKSAKLNIDFNTSSYLENSLDISTKVSKNKITGLFSANYFNFNQRFDINHDNFTDLTLQNRISFFNKWAIERKQNRILNFAYRYIYEDRFGGEMQWKPEHRGGSDVYGESIYTKRLEMIGNYHLPIDNQKVTLNFSFNNHQQNSVYGSTFYLASQQIGFAQLLWDKKLSSKHDALFGATLRQTIYDDNTPATQSEKTNLPDKIWLPGVFFQDEITINKANKVLLGIRYDYNSKHGNIFSPRLNWKFSPNKDNIFRLSFGNGYRVVNVFSEDHAALTGARKVEIATHLKPEKSYNANLDFQRFFTFKGGYGNIQTNVFYTYFNNKILANYDIDPELIVYDNLKGFGVSKGIALNFDFAFTNGLKFISGATLMDVYQIENQNKIQQIQTPHFTANYTISYSLKKEFTVDFTGNFYSPMRLPVVREYGDTRPEYSSWFGIHNIQLSKRLQNGIQFYGGIKNFTNFLPENPIFSPQAPFSQSFDPSYSYAPMQSIRGFVGFRWALH